MSNPGMRIYNNIQRADKNLIEKFRGSASANVSDCMGRLFAMDSRIRAMGKSKTVVGPAFTVKAAIADNMLFHKALTMAKPGDVIVVNACGDLNHSVCGDIMFKYAVSKGIAGFVIDGCIRDVDFLMNNDFPVYAAGVTPRGPYKNGPGEVNSDIACGGQVVHPGDIIIGDEDGIVVVRREDAEEVAKKLEAVRKNEKLLCELIEAGKWEECSIVKALEESLIQKQYEFID